MHRALALLVLAVAATPQLAAAEICRSIFVPPDGVRDVCVGSCASPRGEDEEAVCNEVCSERPRPAECGIFDEKQRRAEPCPGDQRKLSTGECVPLRCAEDEEPANGRCVPLDCAPGSIPMDGRCVRQRMPALQCISADELREVEVFTDNAETLTERQLQGLIALAAAKGFNATLPDGTELKLPPFGDTASPANKRFAASIDRSVSALGLMCSASSMLSCVDPLTTLCDGQEQAAQIVYARLLELGRIIDARPDFDKCRMMREPRLQRFVEAGTRFRASVARFEAALEIFDAIMKTETFVELKCEAPDVTQCGIRVVPFRPEPLVPLERFARRKLKK